MKDLTDDLTDDGPWNVSPDGKHIQSDNFDYDVRLDVSGDFETDDLRFMYAKKLACKLNRSIDGSIQELVDERNMISELMMYDASILLTCILGAHDANSFWDNVRKEMVLIDQENTDE